MYRLLLSPRSSSNGWKVAGGRNLFAKRPAGLTTTTTTATTNNNNNNNNNNNKENGDGAIRRFFSLLPQEEEYKSLEYPNAKEAPEITKTIASEIRGRDPIASQDVFVAETGIKLTPRLHHPRGGGGGGGGEDPIAPSADLVETIRNRPLSKGVSAITRTVPPNIPPNVPAHQLETPETIITQLDNGVRVVRYVYIVWRRRKKKKWISIPTFGLIAGLLICSSVSFRFVIPTLQHGSVSFIF